MTKQDKEAILEELKEVEGKIRTLIFVVTGILIKKKKKKKRDH